MTEVVTCGEAMLLMMAAPGVPLARAESFHRSVAGAETNVAMGLARLGHPVAWLGRVGADPAGRAVLDQVRAAGVDTSHVIVDEAAPTGLLLRDSHPARPIDVQYYRSGSAAARLSAADMMLPPGTRLVHITGITPMLSPAAREATGRLIELAREAGATLSFDPNIRRKLGDEDRWRETVGPLLSAADIVLAGSDELALLGRPDPAALLAERPHTVVVKHEDKSATALTGETTCHQECFPVPLTDPVGAGDAFATGFLSAWLAGRDVKRALAEAAAVAAFVVQSATDVDGLPTAAERDRWLAAAPDIHR